MSTRTGDPAAYVGEVAAAYPRCFWLDGGGARDWSGRQSILGWLEEDDLSLSYDAATGLVTRHQGGTAESVPGDPFTVLEAELATGPPDAQWFGYFGYAARPDLPAATGSGLPDAVWMRARHVRLFHHPDPAPDPAPDQAPDPAPEPGRPGRSPQPADAVPEWYAAAFAEVQEQLHAGNSYEVNLTHRLHTRSDLDPVTAYLRLRRLNPAPYAGFLQHDVPGARAWVLSSSPERYAVIGADRVLETKPIKGTTPRGSTPEEDEQRRRDLEQQPRFRAENLMIVDLLRNDLAMVCAPGTVEVPSLMAVESYRNVHQLVSTVRGRLRDDVTTVQALRALFPAGSMTGAPKLRTMEIIEAVERTPRGPYAGALGWVAADGRADLGVVIRTLTTAGDGDWTMGTGGGITVHSDVVEEHAEAQLKADRVLAVFEERSTSAKQMGNPQ